jgi:site-specific DNA-methyltransferase (adenine-specific)
LESNVREHGCTDSLVVWREEGLLLDGHNRLGICRTHDIPFAVREVSLPDRAAARRWIITYQLGRRNLTAEGMSVLRGMLYLEQKKPEGRPEKLGHNGPVSDGDTASSIAEQTGVSPRTVKRDAAFAAALADVAEAIGDDVREKVLSRDARISRKDVVALSALPDEEKLAAGRLLVNGSCRRLSDALRDVRQAEAVESATGSPSIGAHFAMVNGDLVDVGDGLDAESFDAIITDPPYPKEYIDCYAKLAAAATRLLRPGGSLVAMAGQSYLPDVIAAMCSAGLSYHWMLAYLTPGGQAVQIWPRKVNTFWKPLLWFVKGKYDGPWCGDVSKSDTNDNDKRFHNWGQSESGMVDIVRRLSRPGDRVLDPFAGAATTGIACLRLGREFTGIELDEKKCALACDRLRAESFGSSLAAELSGQSALFSQGEQS